MSVTYKFPHDSPIRYLPLVYMLPYDLLVRCPTLRKLPRSMGALNTSEWGEVIMSQQFLNEVMDAVASLAFPTSASAAGRSITRAGAPSGNYPTPCPCGPRVWSVCGAGACNPFLTCRPSSRYLSLTRTMYAR